MEKEASKKKSRSTAGTAKKSAKESKGWKERELELLRVVEEERQKVKQLELQREKEIEEYKTRESELQKSLETQKQKTRKLELHIQEELEKQDAREKDLLENVEAVRSEARELESLINAETEQLRAAELELRRSIEQERQKSRDLELQTKEEGEKHKARELALLRDIEAEKQKMRDLELFKKEEAEMYKVRDIELRRGIEAEKQRVKDLELLEKEEVGRRKAGELELQRDIEAEMQRVNDLDLLRKEEEEAHKARETELCRIIESEKQKVRDLELRRKEAAEKQRARESELRGSFGVERRKAREIELRTKKEADRQGVKEARLQKSIERERKRALDLERRRKKDEEKQKIREIKLQKIIEEEGRKRRETESRLLRGISRRSETSLRQKVAILLVAALALILVIIYTGSRDTAEYSRTVPLMGTFVQIKAYANGLAGKKLPEEVDEALKLARELEKKFSIWDPGSEINKLNIAGMNVVSLELFNLVNKSKRINHVTGGTFDITVAPILKANGFYEKMPAEIRDKIPDDFGGVGIKNVTLKLDNSIWLRNGAWIDLSGIAKGNIVDSMIELFKQKDIENVMINAGGDLYCGNKSGKKPWIVGIREPGSEKILLKLAVRDMAVATSGDYENVVIDKKTGEVMSHIIDPFRDKPLKETYSSVTVIAPECTDADALATGMMVMNKEDAISLADQMKDVSIIVVTISGGKRIVDFSEGAEKYVVER